MLQMALQPNKQEGQDQSGIPLKQIVGIRCSQNISGFSRVEMG